MAAAAWRRCFARLASAACARKTAASQNGVARRADELYAKVVEYAAGRPLSPSDWERFERQHNPDMRPPFRGQLMSCLASRREHEMAHSLLEYAEGVAGGVTRTMLGHYLALCSTEQRAGRLFAQNPRVKWWLAGQSNTKSGSEVPLPNSSMEKSHGAP
ncbi:hypothetical protein MRX96_007376 [Rhipicephalus microplus]